MSEPEPKKDEPTDSRRGVLIGLLVILLLVVGGLLLQRVLRRESRLEDCLMSGRTNCAPIDASSAR